MTYSLKYYYYYFRFVFFKYLLLFFFCFCFKETKKTKVHRPFSRNWSKNGKFINKMRPFLSLSFCTYMKWKTNKHKSRICYEEDSNRWKRTCFVFFLVKKFIQGIFKTFFIFCWWINLLKSLLPVVFWMNLWYDEFNSEHSWSNKYF